MRVYSANGRDINYEPGIVYFPKRLQQYLSQKQIYNVTLDDSLIDKRGLWTLPFETRWACDTLIPIK